MLHYHGLPITPDSAALQAVSGGHAFVSFASRQQASLAAAAVDSLIFPTLAFGVLLPHIVALQFIAKVAGGALWAAVLARTRSAKALQEGETR
jgi:hypothetical protein